MTIKTLIAASVLATGFAANAAADETNPAVTALLEELSAYRQIEETTARNLATFDTLDFEVYSNQDWDRLGESHAENILVHYPDGTTTTGLHDHVEALKPMFVFAPDTRIDQHPVAFGNGEWTGVIGYIEGTFTQPMPIGNGQFIEPTGKSFKLGMSTIGRWNEDGTMDEEYLFWDNQDFMKQIGLAQ